MKYLAPTSGGMLRRIEIETLVIVCRLLKEAGNVRDWCTELGLTLYRVHLPPPIASLLDGDAVFLTDGLTYTEEVRAIAHEFYHHRFHAATVAFQTLDQFTINKHEREANLFAAEVVKAL